MLDDRFLSLKPKNIAKTVRGTKIREITKDNSHEI